jgi:N-acetylneuraminic acid mutarotase
MPIFSGDNVDPLINKLDTKRLDYAIDKKKYDSFNREIHGFFNNAATIPNRTKSKRTESSKSLTSDSNYPGQRKGFVKITELDKEIIDTYIYLKQQIEIKKLPKIFVDVKECIGIIPESRELATLCTYSNSIYLFGGVGSKRFDYFNEYDMHQRRWYKRMPANPNYTDLPASRYGHTMVSYSDYFILFGGVGTYSEKTKTHESLNDVRVFDIKGMLWEKADYYMLPSSKQFEPEKRMYHGAAVL